MRRCIQSDTNSCTLQTRGKTSAPYFHIYIHGLRKAVGRETIKSDWIKTRYVFASGPESSVCLFSQVFSFDPNGINPDGSGDKLHRAQLGEKGNKLHFAQTLSQTASKLNNKLEFTLKMNWSKLKRLPHDECDVAWLYCYISAATMFL